MTEPDTQRYHPERVLGETPSSEAVKAYSRELVSVEESLLSLERDIAEVPVGITGLRSAYEFNELGERYQECVEQLSELRTAALLGSLDGLDIESDHEFRRRAGDGDFETYFNRLNRIESRVGQRLAAQRNMAHSRLGLAISLIAIGVSTAAIML